MCDVTNKKASKQKICREPRNFPCQKRNCKKKFCTNFELNVHQRWHENKSKYICDVCGQVYRENRTLIEHLMRYHPYERNFECPKPECGKVFFYKGSFKKHVNTHGFFKCEYTECVEKNKQFASKVSLDNHVNIHLNILKHRCDVCPNKCFSNKASLKAHTKTKCHINCVQMRD